MFKKQYRNLHWNILKLYERKYDMNTQKVITGWIDSEWIKSGSSTDPGWIKDGLGVKQG